MCLTSIAGAAASIDEANQILGDAMKTTQLLTALLALPAINAAAIPGTYLSPERSLRPLTPNSEARRGQ
jgi:hypothetical protein